MMCSIIPVEIVYIIGIVMTYNYTKHYNYNINSCYLTTINLTIGFGMWGCNRGVGER